MPYKLIHQVLWSIMIGYWMLTWWGNKKTQYRYNPGKRLLSFILLVIFIGVLYRKNSGLNARILPGSDFVEILAVMATAAGVAIAIWARWTLGRNWSANPSIKEGHELITRGPYRFARHPIYTGILLGLFGTLVLGGGRWNDWILFGFISIGLHFKSRIEEKLMMQTFPNSYPAYRQRTKALIPFVL